MTLFDPEPVAPLSRGRKLTIRNNDLLRQWIHPVTRLPLAEGDNKCGDCANHVVHRSNTKIFHKCDLNYTHGPGTDLRVSWPACTRFEATS